MGNDKVVFKPPKAIRICARPLAMILYSLAIGIALWFTVGYFDEFVTRSTVDVETTFCLILGYGVIGFFLYEFHKGLWSKLFASLEIKEDGVTWRCPTRKTRMIPNENIRYIGVEFENSYNKQDYPFIYISSSTYPTEFAHKIDRLPVTNDFLKFWYTPELGTYLLTHFPSEKTEILSRFHHKQNKDRR